MRTFPGQVIRWTVGIVGGAEVEVWADGFSREGDHYTFGNLVDLENGESTESLEFSGETPTNPLRKIVVVARFPKDLVAHPDGDPDWPAISSA